MSWDHPALPPPVSRPWLAVAGACFIAAFVYQSPDIRLLEDGRFEGTIVLRTDRTEGRFGYWAIAETEDGVVLVEDLEVGGRGDRLVIVGDGRSKGGEAAGFRYGGVIDVARVASIEPSRFPPHVAGRWITSRVGDRLAPLEGGRALLAGFLVGDVSGVDEIDREAMRRSGLVHFVAVSGSNVALFLGILALVTAPLSLNPRFRAIIGLVALPAYAAATRFEPSVVRASVMAGLVLAGRLGGLVFEAWQVLSLAVVIVVISQPSITSSIGFQLSVLATSGVLVGSRWPLQGSRLARALVVTLGAQLAVAPLLLVHFETIPALSPLANLLAAPLVAAATLVGALGVIGVPLGVALAAWIADLVLLVARVGAAWPQLGPVAFGCTVVAGLVSARVGSLRPLVAVVVSGLLVFQLAWRSTPPPGSAVVLDVGQGDAILVDGGGGHRMLIDGGPDAVVLLDRLRGLGVTKLDVVVLTHVHADHATGLIGLLEHLPVGELWAAADPHQTPASQELFEVVGETGVEMVTPRTGSRVELGSLTVEVIGPVRRYASPNDQSIVLMVAGKERTMLLAGDIETFAQQDLTGLEADVLKVPHQGAGTSDPDWLRSVGAELAVVSVGPNQFGHPARWVIDLLEEEGAVVRRTDRDGNVVVELS